MTDAASYGAILVLGLATAAIGVLGFIVFFSNTKSATHKAFLIFSISAVAWGVVNFAAYQAQNADDSLRLWRLVICTATWFCFGIFQLAHVFPGESWRARNIPYMLALLLTVLVSILTLTPYVFSGLAAPLEVGKIPVLSNGPLIPLFGLTIASLVLGSIFLFVKKAYGSDATLKKAVTSIMVGTAITFALLIVFNFVLPTTLRVFNFVPFGAVFILPFVLCTAYAIGRYQIFNIRLVAAELFSFLLVIATLLQIFFSHSTLELIFRMGSFVFVLGLAILFVRSVILEIKQRETIERQQHELESINAQQESLLHFISHEIKGYLTKGQNAFAGIVEGDYGPVPDPVKNLAGGALHEMRKGVSTVMDILDASNFKKGTITYSKQSVDLRKAIIEISDDMRKIAEGKGLQFSLQISPSGDYVVLGDDEKLRHHVIRNLIDNSIRYTLEGSITVSLARVGSKIRFSVSDTGVGITPEDMKRLFTQGGKGKESIKTNVDSTGFGLYVAKQVVVAHEGTIQAKSEGHGKGSTFIVDLPNAS